MEGRIEAIFENGVFKPLGEVALPEHVRVVLKIEGGAADSVAEKRTGDIGRSSGLIPWKGDPQDLQWLLGPDNLPWDRS
jgi:predicted DNA-binding antitoxin AbrB/MazE fold protein